MRNHVAKKYYANALFLLTVFLTVFLSVRAHAVLGIDARVIGSEDKVSYTFTIPGEEFRFIPRKLYGKAVNPGKFSSVKNLTVKSSKKSVATIGQDGCIFTLYAKKSGTTTVTIKYRLEKKTITEKIKVTFKKNPNPFRFLKLAGKNMLKKANLKVSGTKAKLSYKLKTGWKMISVQAETKVYNWNEGSSLSLKIKNGTKIPVEKGKIVQITMKAVNKKTKKEVSTILYVHH